MKTFFALLICTVFLSNSKIFPFLPDGTVSSGTEVTLRNFYQSVAEYYLAPQKEIQLFRNANLKDEEIPVVYYFARTAKVNPEEVVNLRLCGMRWMDVANYYDLNLKLITDCLNNIDECQKHGAKFSKVYKTANKKNLRKLSDKQIIDLINVKFISEDHLCSPKFVQKLRKQGSDFALINQQVIQEHREYIEELRNRTKGASEDLTAFQNQ